MAGFDYIRSMIGETDIPIEHFQLAPSKTVLKGDLLIVSGGKLTFPTVAQAPEFLALEAKTSTATSLTTIKVLRLSRGNALLRVGITPLVNGVAAVSGSTTTAVIVLAPGAADDDMVGGKILLPASNEQRIISANAYAGGNCTFTWIEPVATAVSAGDLIKADPKGPGLKSIKLDSTTPQRLLSNVRNEMSSGKICVDNVDLVRLYAEVFVVPNP